MTAALTAWWVHPVEVERYTGAGVNGDTFAAAVTVTGFVDDGQRLVVGANGEQITSTATVFLPIDTAVIPLQSKVTLPVAFGARTAQVVAVARRDGGGLPLPEHWEVALQ